MRKKAYLFPLSPLQLNQSYNCRNTPHINAEFNADYTHTLLLLRHPRVDFVPQLLAQDALADEGLIGREWMLGSAFSAVFSQRRQVICFSGNVVLKGSASGIEPFKHFPAELCLGGRRDREMAGEKL